MNSYNEEALIIVDNILTLFENNEENLTTDLLWLNYENVTIKGIRLVHNGIGIELALDIIDNWDKSQFGTILGFAKDESDIFTLTLFDSSNLIIQRFLTLYYATQNEKIDNKISYDMTKLKNFLDDII